MKLSEFMSVEAYGHEKCLTNLIGWKWARKYNKKPKIFIRWARSFKEQDNKNVINYKFSLCVIRTVREAYELECQNRNHKWR